MDSLRALKHGLLLFWALWSTIVFFTNVFDGLKAWGVIDRGWPLASGNYGLLARARSRVGAPRWVNDVAFGGATLWQGLTAALFWRATSHYRPARHDEANTAFAASAGMWAAFLVADELMVAYETGVEGAHMRILTAQLVSLLSIHLLPD